MTSALGPIYYGVVFAWLLLATASGAAVIISLFLGGEPPNLDIVKDVIAILGLPAGMIIAKLFDWKPPTDGPRSTEDSVAGVAGSTGT